MDDSKTIDSFAQWGDLLQSSPDEEWDRVMVKVEQKNGWFDKENVELALRGIRHFLKRANLEKWLEHQEPLKGKKSVGVVAAGNIPLAGFHDILCVLASGNNAQVKLSSQDDVMLPYAIEKLTEIDLSLGKRIRFVERLTKPDIVVASGSNNSSRYFEYYFRDIPHIIRKNRTSIAVLTGNESHEDLENLGKDILQYFGLGCRNVSKLLVPETYDFDALFKAVYPLKYVINHQKYANNYDYNRSILLVGNLKFLENGFLIVQENNHLVSPISVLYFERYNSTQQVLEYVQQNSHNIQCIVTGDRELVPDSIDFGSTQKPDLWDYADGINTLEFLTR